MRECGFTIFGKNTSSLFHILVNAGNCLAAIESDVLFGAQLHGCVLFLLHFILGCGKIRLPHNHN